jgi:D-cysteine desulfhydrase family pyridoxal phosphate-dependent enzyme
MAMDLDRFPRVPLGRWPSPLEDAPRLSEALGGPAILLKRDDVNALGAGGNKLRKLEFLLGKAKQDGADTIVTFGALQTNHGRQTAAACAKLGLRCELVLTAKVPRSGDAYERSGNVALDRLFGARLHICADEAETERTYHKLLDEAAADGRTVSTFPTGGSDGVGVLGYVAAARELRAQLAERGIESVRLAVAHGSGGTAAGLALGIALLDWPCLLDVACVLDPAEASTQTTHRLVGEAAETLGVPVPSLEHVRITDRTRGDGYGIPHEGVWEALRRFGRTEGVALDPVYTGKAAAGLIDWVRRGEIGGDETVVFLHTGGLPGLFGYAPEVADSVGP